MLFKKGQGATEYLIILAVIIVIALIVVTVMGGIPGIGSGAKEKSSASFWKTGDISFQSYSIEVAGGSDATVIIQNNMVNTVSLGTFTINGDTMSCSQDTLSAGQQTTCTGDTDACSNSGDSYSLDVSVTYTDSITSDTFTYTGNGRKLEGTCAN